MGVNQLYWSVVVLVGVVISSTAMTVQSSYSPRLKSPLFPAVLPPHMTSNIPNTWAYDTMTRRVIDDIIPRIIEDNADELTHPSSALRSECLLLLNDLKSSLKCNGYLRGIADNGPDLLLWDSILSTVNESDRTWQDAPWLIVEFYLYRRVIEAFRYFETGYDMFVKPKAAGLLDAVPIIDEIAKKVNVLISEGNQSNNEKLADCIQVVIHTSLWGNKMDLSLWPATTTVITSSVATGVDASLSPAKATDNIAGRLGSFKDTLDVGRKYILDDHTDRIIKQLIEIKGDNSAKKQIGIIIDNAGYELFSDILLGHCLLSWGIVDKIVFYTKGHPTFVSDATNEDCRETIDFLRRSTVKETMELGSVLHQYTLNNKFEFQSDLYWCQPIAFYDMNASIEEKMRENSLVFVKGDANYRRLLGERQWNLSEKATDILSYWPGHVAALRTLKAEICVGITEEQENRAKNEDSKWLVSGRWGVIQSNIL